MHRFAAGLWLSVAVLGAVAADPPAVAPTNAPVTIAPLSIRGVNYFPRDTPWGGMWTQTPPGVWEKDMALAASLGANTVRTFVMFSPPMVQAGLLQPNGTPTAAYLAKIDTFLEAGRRNGIRAILCLEFGRETLAAADGPARWRRGLEAVVGAHRTDVRVRMWDLMNEPDDDAKWTEATKAYLRDVPAAVRGLDTFHPTTVGLAWRTDRLEEAGWPDVLQYHEYCQKQALFKDGPGRVSLTVAGQRQRGGARPLLIGEFGMSTARDPQRGAAADLQAHMGDAPGTEDEQAQLYRIVLEGAEREKLAGALAWCLHDYPIRNPNESHFGVVRLDGSLKPAALVLRETFGRWAEKDAPKP